VLSRMSRFDASEPRSGAWRIDFMRSCVIGRGSSVPSSASAIALASSRPIQIGQRYGFRFPKDDDRGFR